MTTGRGSVAVVGSANADLVLRVERRPGPGETVLGSDVVVTPGGKGANQAVAAARAGDVAVSFVGCIGDDDHGRLLRTSLHGAGVDLAAVRTVDVPTGIAMITVTPDGENAIIVSPGANRQLTPRLVDDVRHVWESADVVVLQLEIPLDTVAHVVAAATGRVVVNAAPAARLPHDVIARADPLVVNESEARFLINATNDGSVAPDLLLDGVVALGPQSVVLTLGADGAIVAEARQAPVRVPARNITAVDTTGAGDAFVGTIAVRLAAGASLVDAVTAATDVAAVSATRRGAQESYPTASEVAERYGQVYR